MCSLGRSKLGTHELGSFCCVVRYLTALPHDAWRPAVAAMAVKYHLAGSARSSHLSERNWPKYFTPLTNKLSFDQPLGSFFGV